MQDGDEHEVDAALLCFCIELPPSAAGQPMGLAFDVLPTGALLIREVRELCRVSLAAERGLAVGDVVAAVNGCRQCRQKLKEAAASGAAATLQIMKTSQSRCLLGEPHHSAMETASSYKSEALAKRLMTQCLWMRADIDTDPDAQPEVTPPVLTGDWLVTKGRLEYEILVRGGQFLEEDELVVLSRLQPIGYVRTDGVRQWIISCSLDLSEVRWATTDPLVPNIVWTRIASGANPMAGSKALRHAAFHEHGTEDAAGLTSAASLPLQVVSVIIAENTWALELINGESCNVTPSLRPDGEQY
jgi:hypothetical protein